MAEVQRNRRLSVTISEETEEALQRLVDAHGITYAEAIRRAICLWAFCEEHLVIDRKMEVYDPETGMWRNLELL